jgi:SNF2 family DNA or RNA helicase
MAAMTNCDYVYNVEIDENAPKAAQPDSILLPMKNHQLACLYKALLMEQKGKVHYDVKNNIHNNFENINRYHNYSAQTIKNHVTVSTNIGIFGDIVGHGKTLCCLSLIAASPLESIHTNNERLVSYCSSRNYSYLTYTTENINIMDDNKINSTLIVVPRGPVYTQWQRALATHTKLKYLAIDSLSFIKKNMPDEKKTAAEIREYFNQFDAVLIKNTTLDILLRYYTSDVTIGVKFPTMMRWKRIMVDEAHDICSKIPLMYYDYLWLISGTYENILYLGRSYNNLLHNIRDALNYDTINLALVRCKKEFVKSSFRIPVPIEQTYICRFSAKINAIRNFISPEVLEKINANDITGAVRDLGGKSETEDSVIELVTKEINREIQNKQRERDFIYGLDIPEENKVIRLRNIDSEIAVSKRKLEDLTQRISELKTKMCSICMFEMDKPIILKCTHSYCGVCIMKWLEKNMNCPECRMKIDTNDLIAIKSGNDKNEVVEAEVTTPVMLSKEETLLKIIQDNPNGKYLVFSKHDSGFYKLMQTLMQNNITCSELKGNTSHMNNTLEKFRTGNIRVILLNTYFAGSGIDISYATDVILYHAMGIEKYQAIGRAQRVGRTDTLRIHHLCYEHEISAI